MDSNQQRQQSPKGETAEQAVTRYKALCKALYKDLNTVEDEQHYNLKWSEKPSAEEIANYEKQLPCPLPKALKEFWQQHGACTCGLVNFGDSDTFRLFLPGECTPLGILSKIDNLWGGREDILTSMNEQAISFINNNYFMVGSIYMNDNEHYYLYFNTEGQFNVIRYDQDYLEDMLTQLNEMATSPAIGSLNFDDAVAECIYIIMPSLTEWADDVRDNI
jgi:hypothetical protein